MRKNGKTDRYIIELLNKHFVESITLKDIRSRRKGLLNEVEWFLEMSRNENSIILPLYEGAYWVDKKTRGSTPDFIVFGKNPQGKNCGIFFVEIKSNRRALDNARDSIRKMQITISRIMLLIYPSLEYDIPLYVYFKENDKWNYEKF